MKTTGHTYYSVHDSLAYSKHAMTSWRKHLVPAMYICSMHAEYVATVHYIHTYVCVWRNWNVLLFKAGLHCVFRKQMILHSAECHVTTDRLLSYCTLPRDHFDRHEGRTTMPNLFIFVSWKSFHSHLLLEYLCYGIEWHDYTVELGSGWLCCIQPLNKRRHPNRVFMDKNQLIHESYNVMQTWVQWVLWGSNEVALDWEPLN